MTPEQWTLAERLYHEAAGIAIADRSSWLARACGGDEVVRREVESLVAQDASRTGALDGHALDEVPHEIPDQSLVGRQLGGYEFLSLIDEGGMGQVYRARDLTLPRDVAVKVVSPEFTHDAVRRARFRQEAEVLAAFAHPHIAHIYAFVEAEGRFLLAMELVPGETLAERIARGPLRVSEALDIARQVADALDAAHEQGVIHRDLKPANIRITPEGVVKVLDFGLATTVRPALAAEGTIVTRTAPGTLLGTVAYMSPEQARGESVDKRTDIWAFGCVLFEMLTGRKVFAGPTSTEVLAAILDHDPDWSVLPPTAPQPIVQLLRRCLDKDRKRRLRDIGEARIALDSPSSSPEPLTARRRPWLRYVSIATLVAAALASATWGYVRFVRSTDMQRVEFPMLPPADVTWGEFPPEPVARVSPDGMRIVFAGRAKTGGGDGATGLWVRDLGNNSARYLPGSNDYNGNVQAPFWSPDSKTIAYCTVTGAAKAPLIKKIGVDGRPAGQLDVPCVGDGSWNARGELLFRGRGGLFLVGENGGRLRQITFSDDAEDHRHPRFLPDGQRFLFTQVGPSDKAGIYLGRTDDTRTHRLFPDVSMAEYVETSDGSSYIFFVRIADLTAQPVDAKTLAPSGRPIVVANHLRMGLSRLPSFSVTPSLLTYRNNVGDSTLVWTNRKGAPTGIRYGGETSLNSPALSHDERTLAYARLNYDTNYYELWTLDIASGIPQQVYTTPTIVDAPAFSPDDRRLAFSAGNRAFLITLGSPDATDANPYKRTSDCSARGTCPSAHVTDWSMDGRVILQATGNVAWFTPGQTTPPTIIASGVHAKLSRDGHWITYTSRETRKPEVYVDHFPDGGRKKPISADGGFQPYWRADGGEIFYRNDSGDIIAVQIRLGAQVQVLSAERLFREQLRAGGDEYASRDFIVSSDGQRFLVNRAVSGTTPPVTVVRNWSQGLEK